VIKSVVKSSLCQLRRALSRVFINVQFNVTLIYCISTLSLQKQ